ncbi:MAG: hypothetical protein ACRC01_00680, partial [Deefgea sp.]
SFILSMHPVLACTIDDTVPRSIFITGLKEIFVFVLIPTLLAWVITKALRLLFKRYAIRPVVFAAIFVLLLLTFFAITVIIAPVFIGCIY